MEVEITFRFRVQDRTIENPQGLGTPGIGGQVRSAIERARKEAGLTGPIDIIEFDVASSEVLR